MILDTNSTKTIVSEYEALKDFKLSSDRIYVEFMKQRWINVESFLAELERQIVAGNMEGVGGHKAFSAALFLSDVKKALEQKHFSRGQEKGHEVKR